MTVNHNSERAGIRPNSRS